MPQGLVKLNTTFWRDRCRAVNLPRCEGVQGRPQISQGLDAGACSAKREILPEGARMQMRLL